MANFCAAALECWQEGNNATELHNTCHSTLFPKHACMLSGIITECQHASSSNASWPKIDFYTFMQARDQLQQQRSLHVIVTCASMLAASKLSQDNIAHVNAGNKALQQQESLRVKDLKVLGHAGSLRSCQTPQHVVDVVACGIPRDLHSRSSKQMTPWGVKHHEGVSQCLCLGGLWCIPALQMSKLDI